MDKVTYDYIIAGAGSAGCVLANRLSADPKIRVLLLEAGGDDNWIWLKIPVGYLFAIGNPRSDWMFKTEADPGLNGRVINYPRGKVLGGSSAINAMIYMRGQAADYDGWRQLGLDGWGWDDVLPHFLAQEDHIDPPGPLHRKGGELRVEPAPMRWAVLDAFAEAAAQIGVPGVRDFNSGDNAGCAYFDVTQKSGSRWSAARGFLKPVLDRPNLTVAKHALVSRILIEDGRATGVSWRSGTDAFEATATSEVILSAGAIGSPQILEQSGVGDGERLRGLGEEPGVSGPSPGVYTMQFKAPVRPGDTVTYTLIVTGKRASNSIPGWGLLFNTIEAHNQRHELVYHAELVGFSKLRDYKMPLRLRLLLALTRLPVLGRLLKGSGTP